MNYKTLFRVSLFVILHVAISCSDSGNNLAATTEIPIGALIPLSGDYENQGSQMLATLNFTIEDVNNQFEKENKNTRIKLVYSDT